MDTTGASNPDNEDRYHGPNGASINITNRVYAMDSHGMDRVLQEHGEKMARHIRRIFADDLSRAAVV
jgi:hypothetical protein